MVEHLLQGCFANGNEEKTKEVEKNIQHEGCFLRTWEMSFSQQNHKNEIMRVLLVMMRPRGVDSALVTWSTLYSEEQLPAVHQGEAKKIVPRRN